MKYLVALLIAGYAFLATPVLAQIAGPAVVQPDASLIVNGRRYVLADIEIIPGGRICDTRVSPPVCGSPAYVALRQKVQLFVYCRLRVDLPDPDAAECRHFGQYPTGGEDLGAYLIERGWAKATPTAPPLYHTFETIARSQGRGAWGTRIGELITPPRN